MKIFAVFVLGALFGVVIVARILGLRPAEPPEQVTLLVRPLAQTPAAAPRPPPPVSPGLAALQPAPSSMVPAPTAGKLTIPVAGVSANQLSDTFNEVRGGERHEAIDIMAPKGTAVVAVDDGKIAKLFTSKPGGLTVYQFDPQEKLAYYYAHLDWYAPGLSEGKAVKRGDLIGFVGRSGNANPAAPHLHFSVFVLGPEKRWWQGTAINPYPLLGTG